MAGKRPAAIDHVLRENEELRYRLEEAEDTIRAIQTGQVDAFVVTGADRDQVFTLESADRPYRLFVETMQLGAVTLAEDGTILFCNDYFVHLLARPPERLAGASFREFVAEAERPTYDVLGTAGRGELSLRCGNGNRVPVFVTAHSVDASPGESLICLLVTDLTEQRHFEELQRAQAALQKSQHELRETAARLADANRRKDEFLATLAHELRNPLSPIHSGLEVMKLSPDLPASLHGIRATMERQTNQMIRLIDDLLDASRIMLGKLTLRKCRVNLADVFQSAIESTQPAIVAGRHELTVAAPEQPIYLEADPHRLAQVVSNLLNNAVKYSKAGGRILLTAGTADGHAIISVQDAGIGIAADMQSRIFEMFSQIGHPLEAGYTGLGIGLSLTKSLVQMHGGTIEVHSAGTGQGSRFSIRLPLGASRNEPLRPQAESAEIPALRKLRVLVVDDNKAGADMLAKLVRILGQEVRTVYDGAAGVEAAARFKPDVVFLDLGMPKMSGYDAARQIRAQPWGGDLMLVALTGWGQDEDKRRTSEAGFDRHLVKPAEPADLQAVFSARMAMQKQEERSPG
ncbi:MAG TPA: ATP-binding protein [Woeseiaceae bacterium]|nr:ATP-binding protein [Woeseiaceae bacterium]